LRTGTSGVRKPWRCSEILSPHADDYFPRPNSRSPNRPISLKPVRELEDALKLYLCSHPSSCSPDPLIARPLPGARPRPLMRPPHAHSYPRSRTSLCGSPGPIRSPAQLYLGTLGPKALCRLTSAQPFCPAACALAPPPTPISIVPDTRHLHHLFVLCALCSTS
jgi:hypothetical protein